MKRLLPIFILTMSVSMMAFAQDPAVSQDSGRPKTGYGHDGGAEVFVTGFGLLPHETTGNAISEQATKAGGGSAGYRFRLNASSAASTSCAAQPAPTNWPSPPSRSTTRRQLPRSSCVDAS